MTALCVNKRHPYLDKVFDDSIVFDFFQSQVLHVEGRYFHCDFIKEKNIVNVNDVSFIVQIKPHRKKSRE